MTAAHNRKVKIIEFVADGTSFDCQVRTWNLANNTPDGERFYTQCPDGEFREEAEPDYALEITFFSDWRSGGISDFLVANDQQVVAFQLDHHPDIVGEHVRWAGDVTIKAPNVGGDARTTEITEITLQIKGKPTYSRP